MKHLFTMMLALIAATASAQDFEVDGIYYNILSEDDMTVEVTESPYDYAGNIVIPAEVTYDGGTYSVTTIGDSVFYYCDDLTSISMPSVTTIGDEAFRYCSALTSVSMPSVTTIGDGAFNSCSALNSVEMPEAMTIGDEAFILCSALTSLDIPASVKSIGYSAFYFSLGLTSVYCHWEQPLECDPNFYETVLENGTLYVPKGTIDAYRSVDPWRWFINIEEGNYSGIADTPGSGLSVKVIDGVITVEGGDGTASAPVVEVYSAGGVCVYRGTDSSIGGLGHGVYVVKVGDTVQKVAL